MTPYFTQTGLIQIVASVATLLFLTIFLAYLISIYAVKPTRKVKTNMFFVILSIIIFFTLFSTNEFSSLIQLLDISYSFGFSNFLMSSNTPAFDYKINLLMDFAQTFNFLLIGAFAVLLSQLILIVVMKISKQKTGMVK